MKNYLKIPTIIVISALLLVVFMLGMETSFKLILGSRQINSSVINCQETSELELLAVTPEGTKIYKVKGEKMIVPAILVQSNNGHVAIR